MSFAIKHKGRIRKPINIGRSAAFRKISWQSFHLTCQFIFTLRIPGRDISFPIFIRKEIETRKLERKSKQQISCLNDLLCRLNDIISH